MGIDSNVPSATNITVGNIGASVGQNQNLPQGQRVSNGSSSIIPLRVLINTSARTKRREASEGIALADESVRNIQKRETMTRKDYELIARVFRQAQEDNYGDSSANAGIEYASDLLADALAKENPRFDKDKFQKACAGVTTPNGGKFWAYSGRS